MDNVQTRNRRIAGVRLVQSMYKDVQIRVRLCYGSSKEFGVGVGVFEGSVFSPLLLIIVLEALYREFPHGSC